MTPGTRVTWTARKGDHPVTVTGIVVPSRFVRWAVVQLDSGAMTEVRLANLTEVTPA